MSTWKVDRKDRLQNGPPKDRTPLTFSPTAKPNIPWLLQRMEELKVPLAFTLGLKKIKFTRLHGTHGDYSTGVLRLSTDKRSCEIMDVVLVHELAHHLDEVLGVTKDRRLITEKKNRAQHMPDGYAKKDVGEYLACGFEVFYCGAKKVKDKMKKMNPHLYRTIKVLDREFSLR